MDCVETDYNHFIASQSREKQLITKICRLKESTRLAICQGWENPSTWNSVPTEHITSYLAALNYSARWQDRRV